MDRRSQISTKDSSVSASHRSREERLRRIAANQLRLVTTAQLVPVGFRPSTVRSRSRDGRLNRLHVGVYATHPPPYTLEQRWLAAALACGPGALLSDWPAAALWEVAAVPAQLLAPHVTVPSGRGRSRPGITVHQRPIEPCDVRRHRGVPVTSVDLLLLHLAPVASEAELETMLVAAESKGLLNRSRLATLTRKLEGRPGAGKLRELLSLEPSIARSELELFMVPICRAARVERPRLNQPVRVPERERPLRVDLAWPDLRLAVELDSQRWHGDWERAEADRERDQLLALAGWQCHRLFRRQVTEDPAGTARRLRGLLELRRRSESGRAA